MTFIVLEYEKSGNRVRDKHKTRTSVNCIVRYVSSPYSMFNFWAIPNVIFCIFSIILCINYENNNLRSLHFPFLN